MGITLITIPYWWDLKVSSLAATIYRQRRDLFASEPTGVPIPSVKPSSRGKKYAKFAS
jgi:hypothetical protein